MCINDSSGSAGVTLELFTEPLSVSSLVLCIAVVTLALASSSFQTKSAFCRCSIVPVNSNAQCLAIVPMMRVTRGAITQTLLR